MVAALPWLILQKFGHSKEERLVKKEHLTVRNSAHCSSTKTTFAQPHTRYSPCCHHPQKHSRKGDRQGKQKSFVQAVRSPQGTEPELELSAAVRQENPYLLQIYYLLGEM